MGYPQCAMPPRPMPRERMPELNHMHTPMPLPSFDEQSLAMVYPKSQEYRDLYALDAALCRGTLFGELDMPFCY
jgi:hypothetical protein